MGVWRFFMLFHHLGKPDIALTKYKIAIFCDSEFFHGKDWEVLKPRLEKSNNTILITLETLIAEPSTPVASAIFLSCLSILLPKPPAI